MAGKGKRLADIALLIGPKKRPPGRASPPGEGDMPADNDDTGMQDAMSNLLEAIDAKDTGAMADAFRAAMDISAT